MFYRGSFGDLAMTLTRYLVILKIVIYSITGRSPVQDIDGVEEKNYFS
jgi:hypothetical protein